MKRRTQGFVASLAVAIGLWGAVAYAQQPQPGGLPAGHPPLDVPPGQARPMGQPGGPGGQPGSARPFVPGQGRPGFPPGGFQPQPRPVVVEHASEEHGGGHGGGHCPGHGPNVAPHFDKINWWHGMIAVNNEKAQAGGFVNQLLWRYENHTDACDPKNEPPPFLAALLNLGVLGFIVYRFGKKPIGEALVKRKQTIMSEIETASQLKEAASMRLSEYEEKFEQIEDTLSAMKAEYAAQAEREKKHVIAEAEERRARMVRDAEFRIEQELRAVRIELMQQAVVDATAAAEEIIRKRAAQADLDRMSEEYLSSVRQALGPGGSSLRGGA